MTLSDAEKKYNGFERPVAYFKINDAKLSGESLIYHDIQVTLSAGTVVPVPSMVVDRLP